DACYNEGMTALLLACLASAAAAQPVAVSSTAVTRSSAPAVAVSTPAAPAAPRPFSVELTSVGSQQRVQVMYRVPLDDNPLAWAPGLLSGLGRSLIHPVDTVRGTTFRIYGIRIEPHKLIVEDRPLPAGSRAAAEQAGKKPDSPEV